MLAAIKRSSLIEVRKGKFQVGNHCYYSAEKLKSGSTNEVYKGKFGKSQIVAIKIKKLNQTQLEDYEKRLEHESNHLSRCKHENIIQFYGVEMTEKNGISTL